MRKTCLRKNIVYLKVYHHLESEIGAFWFESVQDSYCTPREKRHMTDQQIYIIDEWRRVAWSTFHINDMWQYSIQNERIS